MSNCISNGDISSKTKQIKEKYCFKYDKSATKKVSKISDLTFRCVFLDNDKILFNNSSRDSSKKEIVVTDDKYNLLEKYYISDYSPGPITNITEYNGNYIVCTNRNNFLFKMDVFTKDFKFVEEFHHANPFFKDKRILSVSKDQNGGLYLCEAINGMLYYLDKNDNISSYKGDWQLPLKISYFNDSLYIIDFAKSFYLAKVHNIVKFSNSKFSTTNLSGVCIAPCGESNSFFVSSSLRDTLIRKYDFDENMIFTKNYMYDERNFCPGFIEVNKNQLIVLEKKSNKPIIYEI